MFEVALAVAGEPIELRPEPKNKHDENAVAVWRVGAGQMGYVIADRAPLVRRRMVEGYEAIYQGHIGSAAYIRVRFGGGSPILPAAQPTAGTPAHGDDDGFHPDPDGPHWGA